MHCASKLTAKLLTFFTCINLFSGLSDADSNNCLKNDDSTCKSDRKLPVTLNSPSPILLWWYEDVFPHSVEHTKTHKLNCPSGRTCFSSCDRKLMSSPNTEAFVFYGTSFLANDLPLPRHPSHIWALVHEESPKNNWLFSHDDGIRVFNYTATFSRQSNYPLTTQFIVDLNDWITSKFFISAQDKNRLRKQGQLAPVVYVQRDCDPPSDRDRYVKELMKYIQIDSYGPCVNNKKMPSNVDGFHKLEDEEYFHFLARYKFHLSFENAICKDYMTEKLFRPLRIGVVPVYMGSSHAFQFMPNNHSAIFVNEFPSPRDLAQYLIELDKDDSKYNEYLRHHKNGIENDWLTETINNRKWKYYGEADKVNFIHRMFAGFECDLCDFVINRKEAINQSKSDQSKPASNESTNPVGIMGCPEPMTSISDIPTSVNRSVSYWEGLYEAQALKNMLLNNEIDSKQFESKYLRRKTDKYP